MALTTQDQDTTTAATTATPDAPAHTASAHTAPAHTAPAHTASDLIAVLDLAPLNEPVPDRAAQATLAAELRVALTEVGFFFVINHGVAEQTIDLMFNEARRLHALPQRVKDSIPMGKVVGGYLGMGGGTSYASDIAGPVRKPNQNEAFFCHRYGYYTQNQYPPLKYFAERCESYIDQLIALGARMLPILALSLELQSDYFDSHFDEPSVSLRMSHYPPMNYEENEWGLAPHTDSSVFTFLPANEVPGLEIRPAGYDWIAPPQLRGSYLVNSGDMLKRWTNGLYLSTAHRARNMSAGDRYAVPFFYGARDDAIVEPVPTTVSEQRPARHEPITYGDYQRWFLNRNYANVTGEQVGHFES